MGDNLLNLEGRRAEAETTFFPRLIDWLSRLVSRVPDHVDKNAYADALLDAFQPGLPISHPRSGAWYASLDVIDLEDNQVEALVRLSPQSPSPDHRVRRGLVDEGEQGWEMVAAPVGTQPTVPRTDLLLTYSFPLMFQLNDNLSMFSEFAGNELRRLR